MTTIPGQTETRNRAGPSYSLSYMAASLTAPPNHPSVTVSEIVQLALPSGSRVVAGQADLARRVHWARVLRTRPTGAVEPGELLILPAGLLDTPAEARVAARLIAELIDTGVAAFVVLSDPPETLRLACEQGRTPLLQVHEGTAAAEVERSVISLILDRDALLRRRADEVYGRLLTTMLGNAGLPALVAALAEATGLLVAVFDDYGALQTVAPSDDGLRAALAVAAFPLIVRESGAGAARANRPIRLAFEASAETWTGHLYPLKLGAARAGHLGLLRRPGQAGELDRLLADRAATLVALELAKQRAVAEATLRSRGEFLDDLLDGNFPSDDVARLRARQLGYDLLRPHLTFVLAIDPGAHAEARPEAHVPATRQRRHFGEVARAALFRLEQRALSIERDGVVIVLVPADQAAEPGPASELAAQLRVEVQTALPDLSVSAGIGRAVLHPREVPSAYEEAAQALAIAQKLHGGARTVHFGRLGIERLLYHLLGHPELERFATELLGNLQAYDADHRADLVRTLEVFLACNGNHVRAARELNLHRNTLLYRLARIGNILGRDLDDAETRLALQVALRSRAALQPVPQPPKGERRRVARGRPGRP